MQATRLDDGQCLLLVISEQIFVPGTLSHEIATTLADHADANDIILDLRWIEMIHSPVLSELVQIFVSLSKRGLHLRLRNLSDFNHRLLTMTKIDQLITIE
ncbi:MAG: STAS domain-containing protein [Planctomycetota bacterium]|jgi:anti-anti-sigma factor